LQPQKVPKNQSIMPGFPSIGAQLDSLDLDRSPF
jgi:hypothetical protein